MCKRVEIWAQLLPYAASDIVNHSMSNRMTPYYSYLALCTAASWTSGSLLEAFTTMSDNWGLSPESSTSSRSSAAGTFLLLFKCSSLLFFLSSTLVMALCWREVFKRKDTIRLRFSRNCVLHRPYDTPVMLASLQSDWFPVRKDLKLHWVWNTYIWFHSCMWVM